MSECIERISQACTNGKPSHRRFSKSSSSALRCWPITSQQIYFKPISICRGQLPFTPQAMIHFYLPWDNGTPSPSGGCWSLPCHLSPSVLRWQWRSFICPEWFGCCWAIRRCLLDRGIREDRGWGSFFPIISSVPLCIIRGPAIHLLLHREWTYAISGASICSIGEIRVLHKSVITFAGWSDREPYVPSDEIFRTLYDLCTILSSVSLGQSPVKLPTPQCSVGHVQ